MLPPTRMLTTKKRAAGTDVLSWIACALLLFAGCTPAGPRALFKGERLMREGDYAAAAVKFEEATRLLPNEPQAWNHLGLAYHGAGRVEDAARAYQRALSLDRNLAVARYNLGCLYLETTNLPAAIGELTTFTSLQPNAESGWVKLGTAQLQAHQADAAERSFGQALRLEPRSVEAMNGLGLLEMQRRRYPEASRYFNSALRVQPAFAPALLNAAVVAQQNLNDRFAALQRYRQFLALKPRPAGWQAVEKAANDLEAELRPPPPVAEEPRTSTPPPKPGEKPSESLAQAPKRDARGVVRPPAASAPAASTASNRSAAPVVKTSPPEPRTEPVTSPRPRSPASDVAKVESSRPTRSAAPAGGPPPEGRKIAIDPEPTVESRPIEPATAPPPATGVTSPIPTGPILAQPSIPRYRYRNLPLPKLGDRDEADRQLAEGLSLQENYKLKEAIERYRAAIQADPSCFDAYYNLGVASFAGGDLTQTLDAYERAVAIDPTSMKARFNFAIALERAGYPRDAANELEKVLDANPTQTRAHFTLGHLYADKLHELAKARACYLRVLELDPQHPQATAIRYWLETHP
jgi:tetratricopeptide (TPR) repeat protein